MQTRSGSEVTAGGWRLSILAHGRRIERMKRFWLHKTGFRIFMAIDSTADLCRSREYHYKGLSDDQLDHFIITKQIVDVMV